MRVVLLGKAPGNEEYPKDAENVWGLNDLIVFNPNLTLSFEMHDVEKHKDIPFMRDEINGLNKAGIPVLCQKHYPILPNSTAFPIDEFKTQYFTSTVSYMLAYAVYKKATRIEMYGIQMATRVEYTRQRPCCEYWIGQAEASGAEVYVHRPSQLMFEVKGRYGYDWDNIGDGFSYPDAVIADGRLGNQDVLAFTKI